VSGSALECSMLNVAVFHALKEYSECSRDGTSRIEHRRYQIQAGKADAKL